MLPAIETLRGIAILLVVTYHVWEKTRWSGIPVVSAAGYLGVELFFFVSGFVLMWGYLKGECRGWAGIGEWARRRALKILPGYWLALVVVGVWLPFDGIAWRDRWLDIGVHAVMAHGLWDATFVSLNGNFWSLAVEVEFYLLFPLLAWVWGLGWLGVLLVGWFVYVGVMPVSFITSYQLPAELPLFLGGMLTAQTWKRWNPRPITAVSLYIAGWTGFIWIAWLLESHNCTGGCSWAWRSGHGIELALCFMAIALGLLTLDSRGDPITRWMGDVSYQVYLWNALIVWWWPVNAWVTMALSFGVGWVLTRVWERPIMRWGRGRRKVTLHA